MSYEHHTAQYEQKTNEQAGNKYGKMLKCNVTRPFRMLLQRLEKPGMSRRPLHVTRSRLLAFASCQIAHGLYIVRLL